MGPHWPNRSYKAYMYAPPGGTISAARLTTPTPTITAC